MITIPVVEVCVAVLVRATQFEPVILWCVRSGEHLRIDCA
jgi:hypothetical protein